MFINHDDPGNSNDLVENITKILIFFKSDYLLWKRKITYWFVRALIYELKINKNDDLPIFGLEERFEYIMNGLTLQQTTVELHT